MNGAKIKSFVLLFLIHTMQGNHSEKAMTLVLPVAAVDDRWVLVWVCENGVRSRVGLVELGTGKVVLLLGAKHNPEMPAMSPSGDQFCFVENDILKVKLFNKRSPRSFSEFGFPIFDIKTPCYFTNKILIFSAKYDHTQRYGLFGLLLADGGIIYILKDEKIEYVSPFSFRQQLYCVGRLDEHDVIYQIGDVNQGLLFNLHEVYIVPEGLRIVGVTGIGLASCTCIMHRVATQEYIMYTFSGDWQVFATEKITEMPVSYVCLRNGEYWGGRVHEGGEIACDLSHDYIKLLFVLT